MNKLSSNYTTTFVVLFQNTYTYYSKLCSNYVELGVRWITLSIIALKTIRMLNSSCFKLHEVKSTTPVRISLRLFLSTSHEKLSFSFSNSKIVEFSISLLLKCVILTKFYIWLLINWRNDVTNNSFSNFPKRSRTNLTVFNNNNDKKTT